MRQLIYYVQSNRKIIGYSTVNFTIRDDGHAVVYDADGNISIDLKDAQNPIYIPEGLGIPTEYVLYDSPSQLIESVSTESCIEWSSNGFGYLTNDGTQVFQEEQQ